MKVAIHRYFGKTVSKVVIMSLHELSTTVILGGDDNVKGR